MSSPRDFAKLQLFFLTLGILALLLPWTIHPSSGLSLNAYDVANWSTRHVDEFRGSLVLLTGFLIRGQLFILTAIVSRMTLECRWLFCVILFIALLPPLDGFLREPGNPNYRQLALLALATALIAIMGSLLKQRWIHEWQMVLPVLGLVSCLYATSRLSNLYHSLKLDHQTGSGLLLLLLTYLSLLIIAILRWKPGILEFLRKPYVRLHN